jgi:hypothetical protein
MMMTLDLVSPIIAITIIFYYQFKLSGIPNTQAGQQRIKYTSIAVVVWSVARFIQFFYAMYLS